jgi:hypothetical protein
MGKRLQAILLFAVAVFFLIDGFQRPGSTNLMGQYCNSLSYCIHVEWLALGIGLIAFAYYLWPKEPTP